MRRTLNNLITGLVLMAGIFAPRFIGAQPLVGAFSFDAPINNASISADDGEIVGVDSNGDDSLLIALLTDLLPPEADIDAFDFVGPTRVYLSLDAPAFIGGTLYQDEDVILWNGSVASLAWQGAANGLPPETDIDGLSIIAESPLEFSLSLNSPASLTFTEGTFTVGGAAVFRFVAGDGFTGLDFDPGVAGLPAEADVDAVNRPGDGRLALSFDTPILVGATLTDDGDAIAWNTVVNDFEELLFSAASAGLGGEADLDGIELNNANLNGYDGRPFGDFDNSGCTDITDFLFLLDYWNFVSPIGGEAIGITDFLALLDFWNTGANCP